MPDVRLTDGGLETSLIFGHGLDLPLFAAFPLLETKSGRAALRTYWLPYLELAGEKRAGFVVDTATWRANTDWGAQLGYDSASLRATNEAAAGFARELATQIDNAVVNGVVGPRGDGYVVDELMSPDEAAEYHQPQIEALADAGVDQVSALTFTYAQEAVGFARAATAFGLPVIVSFTVETDGRLPSGQPLRDAVEAVDDLTDHAPAGYMINCAHPAHFEDALVGGDWLQRLTGVRANASTMSHAELDAAEDLDDGDPADLAARYRDLRRRLPALEILGGCCGTDHRHIRAISDVAASSG
jgi:S-methylmethionine-dependent homocysteine/selenocysteine methylase